MKIAEIHVINYRCIRDEKLQFDDLTTLVGRNGSGKSSFLSAMELFYDPSKKYTEDDFYNGETEQEISVTVSFDDLTAHDLEAFQNYTDGEMLSIEKVISWPYSRSSQRYYGKRLKNEDFNDFRNAEGASLRREFQTLRETFLELPAYQNKDEAEFALREWEVENPDRCRNTRDDGKFFGFKEVGSARLERFTKFILVPAVRDASEDALEGKNSLLTELMDLVVRQALANREDIRRLQEQTQEQYNELINPEKIDELQQLEANLNETLGEYAGNASARFSWTKEDSISIPMPIADVRLIEDDYESRVGNTGHGLQRAFILSMVQHLALAQNAAEEKPIDEREDRMLFPNLVLGIEEPELYQHPNRQRNIAKVLDNLAINGIPGVVEHTQVVYSTHSPLFVNLNRLDKIRSFRKIPNDAGGPRETRVVRTSLEHIVKELELAHEMPEGQYTVEGLLARLKAIMTPWMNEGFFADIAVLVEGEEDLAVITAMAISMGINLENLGISVIPCGGKNSLDRPLIIFKSLGTPVYVIWDCDSPDEGAIAANQALMRLTGHPVEDFPEFVQGNCACFETNMTDVFRSECGEEFYLDEMTNQCKLLNMDQSQAMKSAYVISKIIQRASNEGNNLELFRTILMRIVESAN